MDAYVTCTNFTSLNNIHVAKCEKKNDFNPTVGLNRFVFRYFHFSVEDEKKVKIFHTWTNQIIVVIAQANEHVQYIHIHGVRNVRKSKVKEKKKL